MKWLREKREIAPLSSCRWHNTQPFRGNIHLHFPPSSYFHTALIASLQCGHFLKQLVFSLCEETHEMKRLKNFAVFLLAWGGRIKNRRLFLQIMRSEYLAIFIGRFFGSTVEREIFFADIYINSDGAKYLRQEVCISEGKNSPVNWLFSPPHEGNYTQTTSLNWESNPQPSPCYPPK